MASLSSCNTSEVNPLLLEVIDILAEFGKEWRELCAQQRARCETPGQIAEVVISTQTATATADEPREAEQ